jgi:hypothetical protein
MELEDLEIPLEGDGWTREREDLLNKDKSLWWKYRTSVRGNETAHWLPEDKLHKDYGVRSYLPDNNKSILSRFTNWIKNIFIKDNINSSKWWD